MRYLQNDLYGRIKEDVTTYDGNGHTLDHICTILYATVYSLLTALSDTVDVMVLEPVDVG